ncbi:4,5-DOPA dioxygenase extradiol [Gammaproteobacteria bacterium]
MIYDYYGFPKESYDIQYPVSGDPVLANRIVNLLKRSNIEARSDDQRGFDHGVFVPLKIMYPNAEIPCVQLSLVRNMRPDQHIIIGKALTDIIEENVLVIGSGFSFHNLRAFFEPPTKESELLNQSFEQWLIETCFSKEFSESEREKKLINWEAAPGARYCHPREEHLLPLHVCYGIARSPARQVFRLKIMERHSSAYLWQN